MHCSYSHRPKPCDDIQWFQLLPYTHSSGVNVFSNDSRPNDRGVAAGHQVNEEVTTAQKPPSASNKASTADSFSGIDPSQPLSTRPEGSQDTLAVSLLLKRAHQKVYNRFWRSDDELAQTSADERELLDTLTKPTHLSQSSKHNDSPLNKSSSHLPGGSKNPSDASEHGHLTSANMSALNASDLQGVIKEAEELGFEAAMVSHHQTPTAGKDDNITPRIPAYIPLETGGKWNASTQLDIDELMTEDEDQMGLGAAFGVGHGRDQGSRSELQQPGADTVGFAIDDIDEPVSMSGDSIEALIAQTEDEESVSLVSLIRLVCQPAASHGCSLCA